MTLVELIVVLTILTVALSVFSRTLASSSRLEPLNRETVLAGEAARGVLEEMRAAPFRELFARFNDDPADDPDGPGTAPGSRFEVADLQPMNGKLSVGSIVLPVIDGDLREDVQDPLLGMPRDLDGDAQVDSADHRKDALLLPVRVRIEWRSGKSDRHLELYAVFAEQ